MRRGVLVVASTVGVAACSLLPLGELQSGDGGTDASSSDALTMDVIGDMSPSDGGDVSLPCPDGSGPPLVRMEKGLCIDSTEVTRAQYLAFLNANPSTGGQLPECGWNASFVPSTGVPTASQNPITNIDWCDAYAYCKWAGKELCGSVGDGGPVPMSSFLDWTVSMWDRACTKAGTRVYPYGSSYQPGACNSDSPEGGKAPVGTFPNCVGGYPGIYDMVGNVGEWENSCTPASDGGPVADICQRRGGTYDDMSSCGFPEMNPRNYVSSGLGVRCCKHD